MKNIRLATVLATGRKYLVQKMEINSGEPSKSKVHCWGEVLSYKGLASKHEASKCFLRDAVEIVEVEKTEQLLKELFQQNVQVRRSKGHTVVLTKNGARDLGTPEEQEARRDANARLMKFFQPQ